MRALRPGAAGFLYQRPEDTLVAGECARMGSSGSGSGGRRPDLQHRDADSTLDAAGEGLGEFWTVAVRFEEHHDRSHPVALAEREQPVGGIQDRAVSRRDDRVVADPAPRVECVDRDVAALRDHRHGAGGKGLNRVAPDRHVRRKGNDAVAVRSADWKGSAEGGFAELALEFAPALDLTEAGGDDDGAAAARVGGGFDRCADVRRRHGYSDGVHRLGKVRKGGEALDVADSLPLWVDAPDRPIEAKALEVAQDDVAVRAGAVSGPYDRDGTRLEQSIELHMHLPGNAAFATGAAHKPILNEASVRRRGARGRA